MDCPPPSAPEPAPVSDLAARRRRRPHHATEQDGPPGWWSPDAHDLHLAVEVDAALVHLATETLRVVPADHHGPVLEVIEGALGYPLPNVEPDLRTQAALW